MLIAVAAMASVSCQKEEAQAPVEPKSTTITLKADVVDTKTYITEGNAVLWGTGEYVKLYYNDGADKYAESKEEAADLWNGEAGALFSFDIAYNPAESYLLGGVYPVSVTSISDDETVATSYKVELPATQNATPSSYDPAAFIMIMKPVTVTSIETEDYSASFRRATALNKITLTGVKEDITSVEVTAEGTEKKVLAGRRYFNLTTGEDGEIYYSQTNTIKVNADYTGSSIDVWFTSWGVELAAGEKLTIKMTSATKTYTRTITVNENGIKFIEGGLNKLTVDMSSAEEAVLDNLTGKYLIAAMPTKWMLMSGTNSGSYYNRVESNVSTSAEEVLSSDFYGVAGIEDCVWMVAKMEGGYSLQNIATGKYLKLNNSDGNSAHTSETAVAFDITVTDKVAKVVPKEFTNRELEYNSSSPRFAFYKNTQNDIYFIPWVEDTTPRISVSTNSIEVDADATSCEFTYELRNVAGTPEVSVAAGATMTEVDPSVEGNTVTVKFDANAEDAVKTATIVLSIDGADNVEVTITQKAYVDPSVIEELTVAEFLLKEVSTDVWYQLTGTISNIYNTTYGNFYLTDEAGDQVTVYGLKASESAGNTTFSTLGLKEGDVVTLIGNRSAYNSTPQVGNAYYVRHIAATDAPTISFADNTVTIEAETGATIYYTTDGTDPTTTSALYSAPFEITETKTVKAIAVADGEAPSLVTSKKCTYVDPDAGEGETTTEQELSWTLGTKAYSENATINGTSNISVLKLGTSSAVGSATVTLPAGTVKVKFSAVGWNGKTSKLEFKNGSTTIYSTTLTANSGAKNNTPYTITATDTDNYEFNYLVDTDTIITLSTVSGSTRAIIWNIVAVVEN